MQTQIQYTNTVKVLDCLEYTFKQITIANGFLTDGICVDRKRDPRKLFQNKDDEYRRLNGIVRIKVGNWKKAGSGFGGGPIGNTRRKVQTIEFLCCQTLTSDQSNAGIDCEMLKDWLRHDIEWALRSDLTLLHAAQAVAAEKSAAGIVWGNAPEVINASLDQGLVLPQLNFPDIYQKLFWTYEYDESAPHGDPGLPE